MSSTMLKVIKSLLMVSTLLVFATSASANIGKIVYGYGNNYALDSDGNRRDLKKGSGVREGDTLVTGRGRMHVRLIDGGFISVYPNSEYKIDKFKFSGNKKNKGSAANKKVRQTTESKEDRGFFSLLKGAARQVTGLLGRTHKDNFKFKTSVATIGIRGTGFFVKMCQADCFDAEGNPIQDGMYVKNNTGIITMTTNAGDVVLAQGQSAFAASSEDAPQQIIQPPIAYEIVAPAIELFDFDERQTPVANEIIAEPIPIPPANPAAIVVNNLEYTFMDGANKSTVRLLQGFSATDPGASIQQNDSTIERFDTLVVIPSTGGLAPAGFDKGTAVLGAESGENATLGVVWQRWSGGYTYNENGNAVASLDNNIHLIGSAALTQNLPTSGTISYAGTGGTQPTFSGVTGNQVGTQTVTAKIDYGSVEVTNLNITATFTDATVNAFLFNTSGNSFSGSGGNIYSMTGSCAGAECGVDGGGAVSGKASVNMVGPNAEGIYGIYNLSSGTGENATSGSYLATELPPPL